VGFSNSEGLITNKVQADDPRHLDFFPVSKVAFHRIANHFADFLDRFPLGSDRVAQRGGDEAPVDFILTHFKDDFAHGMSIARVKGYPQGITRVWEGKGSRKFHTFFIPTGENFVSLL